MSEHVNEEKGPNRFIEGYNGPPPQLANSDQAVSSLEGYNAQGDSQRGTTGPPPQGNVRPVVPPPPKKR